MFHFNYPDYENGITKIFNKYFFHVLEKKYFEKLLQNGSWVTDKDHVKLKIIDWFLDYTSLRIINGWKYIKFW